MWSKQGRLRCRTAQNNRLNKLRIHRNRRPKSGLIVELGTLSKTAALHCREVAEQRRSDSPHAAVQPIARNLS
jgi:hypothetical protein